MDGSNEDACNTLEQLNIALDRIYTIQSPLAEVILTRSDRLAANDLYL